MSVIFTGGKFKEGTVPAIMSADAGLTGIFDTLLAVNGTAMDADMHYARLLRDVDIVLGYPQSAIPTLPALEKIWHEILIRNNLENTTARIRTHIADKNITVSAESTSAPETLPPLTCAIIRDYPRVAGDKLENSKRADYTRSYLAREAAKALGADEAILTNTNGMIACGAVASLFIEESGVLITPPLSDGVLASISRAKILAAENAREESISEERLRNADAAFLTNSLIGMRKISQIS